MLRVEETERVEDIFSRMDSDADGFITIQEHRFIFLLISILKIFFKKIYGLLYCCTVAAENISFSAIECFEK